MLGETRCQKNLSHENARLSVRVRLRKKAERFEPHQTRRVTLVEWGWRLADGGGARRQAGVLVASPAKLGKGKHTASRLQIATTMHESFMVNSLAHGVR